MTENKLCDSCLLVNSFHKHDYWLHKGNGNKIPSEINYSILNINHNTIHDDILKDLPILTNVFYDRKQDFFHLNKPNNVVWFSPGDWIINPYYYSHTCTGIIDDDQENEDSANDLYNNKFINTKIFMIKNPKNIMRIKTLEDLENFTEKYVPKPQYVTDQTFIEYLLSYVPFADKLGLIREYKTYIKYSSPDWDLIKKSGYSGIEFGFGKTLDIGASWHDHCNKYSWHWSYDVISLCIWDFETAFDNTIVPCIINVA
jgi:hypothetical protein